MLHHTLARRGLGLALAAGALAVPAVASGHAHAHAAACKPGVYTVHGQSARTFCGPATASVTVGGHTAKIHGTGMCQVSHGLFTVNIGTIGLGGDPKPLPDYLGLDIQSTGKAFGGVQTGGKKYGLTGTVRFGAGKKSGTFTGTEFTHNSPVRATFRCS